MILRTLPFKSIFIIIIMLTWFAKAQTNNSVNSYVYVTTSVLLQDDQSTPKNLAKTLQLMYNDLHETIHDPLFSLKTWAEFQNDVDILVQTWEAYKCLNEQEVLNANPKVNLELHRTVLVEIESCLNDFINSLDSGYQPDFEVPCDTLGRSINALTQMYEK